MNLNYFDFMDNLVAISNELPKWKKDLRDALLIRLDFLSGARRPVFFSTDNDTEALIYLREQGLSTSFFLHFNLICVDLSQEDARKIIASCDINDFLYYHLPTNPLY